MCSLTHKDEDEVPKRVSLIAKTLSSLSVLTADGFAKPKLDGGEILPS